MCVAFLCLLLLLVPASAAALQATPFDTAAVPRIDFVDPPFAVPAELRDTVRFGWLTVPRDHEDAASGTLRLALAIIAPRTEAPAPDPIIILPGGPGDGHVQGAVSTARSERAGLHRRHRALVLLDPRGHGLSEPRTCPELDFGPLTETDTIVNARVVRVLATCRERLAARDETAAVLSSVQVARDLEVLRRALGAPQLNLIGGSYGTRLAAEAMREVPWAVRAVVMFGPVPPGMGRIDGTEVLGALFARCAEQPACVSAFPDLAADYDSVLAHAQRAPLIVRVRRAAERAGARHLGVAPGPGGARLQPQPRRGRARSHPHHRAARTPASGRDGTAYDRTDRDCRRSARHVLRVPLQRRPPVGRAGDGAAVPRVLGERYGDTLALPLHSEIPALVMTGEFDPRTPPSSARRLGEGLVRGHIVILPWQGHAGLPDCRFQLTTRSCARRSAPWTLRASIRSRPCSSHRPSCRAAGSPV